MRPQALIVAGPNGAGKTTYAREHLKAHKLPFLNADEIAASLNPDRPWEAQVAAARTLFLHLDTLVQKRESYVLETTLSGQSLRRRVSYWQQQGYRVKMVFIVLESPQAHVLRVQHRVNVGFHHVPEADVLRRYHRCICEPPIASPCNDSAALWAQSSCRDGALSATTHPDFSIFATAAKRAG